MSQPDSPPRSAAPDAPAPLSPEFLIYPALALAVLAVYAQTAHFGFVSFDDPDYVLHNPAVRAGLTLRGCVWAFTTLAVNNWHPLTWLSHMLVCQLFGLRAGAHHLVNVLLHLLAVQLLFAALSRMTRRPWRSALVAALFAIHPLHVESTAWIAERKDVLSGFFAMLTLFLYARYAEAPSARRYAGVALAFAAGLMAKAMLVTLPFVLLLLDVWPLRRLNFPAAAGNPGTAARRRLWEKLPLFALACVSAGLTALAHAKSGDHVPLALFPLDARLANAVVSCAIYLREACWPVGLAVFYPYHAPSAPQLCAALALCAVLTAAALCGARRAPYLLVGWLWFLGMLAPVSGLFQVGAQAMADRFTYLPLVGVSLAAVWGLADLVEARRAWRTPAALAAAAALVLFARLAYAQTGLWKNSETLYEHALEVTTGNPLMHSNLGVVFDTENKPLAAIAQYEAAIAILPDYAEAHNNLGLVLGRMGRIDDAIAQFKLAVQINGGNDPEGENDLCAAYYHQRRLAAAAEHCRKALALRPGFVLAHDNFVIVLVAQGRPDEAEAELRRVLALDPNFPGARDQLALLRRQDAARPRKKGPAAQLPKKDPDARPPSAHPRKS